MEFESVDVRWVVVLKMKIYQDEHHCKMRRGHGRIYHGLPPLLRKCPPGFPLHHSRSSQKTRNAQKLRLQRHSVEVDGS